MDREVVKYKHIIDLIECEDSELCHFDFGEILFNFESFDWYDMTCLFLFFDNNYIINTQFKSRNGFEYVNEKKHLGSDCTFLFYLHELRYVKSFKFKNSNTLKL